MYVLSIFMIRKVAWVFASAAVLVGIGSLIWSSRGTIRISEVVASCREDATRVCASEVVEGGGTGIELEDITRYDGGSTSDATLTDWTGLVDCLRRHEHLLHHICRYNLVSYDNSRDDKYSDARAHQRQYAVPIIVCMYSLIPTIALVYSLYMTFRIHQLQSSTIRLHRDNRTSEAEDGLGCSADIATGATGLSRNDRIETIGFHYDDCVQGGVLFELVGGTVNVIMKHDDDGEGGAVAVRVLSQLAGRATERTSSTVVHTVNSRLMSSSDYHYVMSSQHACRWLHPDDCRHLWECGLTLWQTIVHYALLGASVCSVSGSQDAALSQAYRLMVDMELESKADRPFDRSSPWALGHLDALKTQIAIHVVSNTPSLLIVDDPFLGLDGPLDDQSGELLRVLDHVARTYGTIVILVLSFHHRHHSMSMSRRKTPSSLFGLVHSVLAMGRDGRMIFSGSVIDMTAFMSEPSTSSIISEKLNIDRRYLNGDSEYLEAVLHRLGEGTTDHSPATDEQADDDDDGSSEDGLSMQLLCSDQGTAVPSSSSDLSEKALCDSFDRSSYRRSSLQTIGSFDRTQARELLLLLREGRGHTAAAAVPRHWMELLCILLSRALHSDFRCSLLRRSHAVYFAFVFGASLLLLSRVGFPSSSLSLTMKMTTTVDSTDIFFVLLAASSCLFQAQLIAHRAKAESATAVHDLAEGFVSSAWPFVFCVSLMDVLHAFVHSGIMLICSRLLLLNTGVESRLLSMDHLLTASMVGVLTWRSLVFCISLALHDSSASIVVAICVIIVTAAVCSAVLLPLSGAIFHPITALLCFWCMVVCKMMSAHSIHHRIASYRRHTQRRRRVYR